MSARWVTFFLWAAVAASAAAWGLKLFASAPTGATTATVAAAPVLRGDIARVLGVDAVAVQDKAAEAAPSADARFQLVGVVAARGGGTREGVAVIAVDGKPAKAFRVGAVVDGELVLQVVRARGIEIGPAGGGQSVALELAPPAAAATGSLPAAGAAPTAAPPPAPPPTYARPPAPVPRIGGRRSGLPMPAPGIPGVPEGVLLPGEPPVAPVIGMPAGTMGIPPQTR